MVSQPTRSFGPVAKLEMVSGRLPTAGGVLEVDPCPKQFTLLMLISNNTADARKAVTFYMQTYSRYNYRPLPGFYVKDSIILLFSLAYRRGYILG